jgi:hypothetical protein
MAPMRMTLLLLLVFCPSLSALAQCVTTSLRDNAIVSTSDPAIPFSGKGRPVIPVRIVVFGSTGPRGCGVVKGSIPDAAETCNVPVNANGDWSTSLQLEPNIASLVRVEQVGCERIEILVTPANPADIKKRGSSSFQIDWTPEGEREVLAIGRGTLNVVANPQKFVERVKRELLSYVTAELTPYDITIGGPSAPNKIHLLGDVVADAYAWTKRRDPPDCGDVFQNDNTEIYVGSIAEDIRTRPFLWATFKRDDGDDLRADDVGHILGTIVLHEVLHASGLLQCTWMQGDVTGHNDPRFERGSGHRYDSGKHLMDTFAMVAPEALIGRGATATSPRPRLANDSFSANYLQLIHPRP